MIGLIIRMIIAFIIGFVGSHVYIKYFKDEHGTGMKAEKNTAPYEMGVGETIKQITEEEKDMMFVYDPEKDEGGTKRYCNARDEYYGIECGCTFDKNCAKVDESGKPLRVKEWYWSEVLKWARGEQE